jgi:hypothetical protein
MLTSEQALNSCSRDATIKDNLKTNINFKQTFNYLMIVYSMEVEITIEIIYDSITTYL